MHTCIADLIMQTKKEEEKEFNSMDFMQVTSHPRSGGILIYKGGGGMPESAATNTVNRRILASTLVAYIQFNRFFFQI